MSQYMHFFVSSDTLLLNFMPIDCFSRNSIVYQITNQVMDVPYEKIDYILKKDLQECINIAKDCILSKQETIALYEKKIDIISNFNNSVEEKLAAIDDVFICIDECKEELEELEKAQYFFMQLQKIDSPIYVGIECGPLVTIKDIRSKNNKEQL